MLEKHVLQVTLMDLVPCGIPRSHLNFMLIMDSTETMQYCLVGKLEVIG